MSRCFNLITGAFLCQFFLSRTKIHKNTVIPTIKQLLISLSYFYIVSRQEETRFQLVLKPPTKTLKLIVSSLKFFLIIPSFSTSLKFHVKGVISSNLFNSSLFNLTI